MNNQNEDYLDQLLNSLSGQGEQAKEMDSQEHTQSDQVVSSSFLEEFEKELAAMDADDFISKFESELEDGLESVSELELEPAPDFEAKLEPEEEDLLDKAAKGELPEDFFDGLEKAMTESEVSQPSVDESINEIDNESDNESDNEPGNESVVEEAADNAEFSDDDIFNALLSGDREAVEADEEKAEPSEDITDGDDILQLLSGMSDSEELSDIEQMLKAQDEHVDISFDQLESGISEEEALHLIRDLDEEQPVSTEKVKKNGFLSKLSNFFFGPEEEEEQRIHVHPTTTIENTTAENMDILNSLEGDGNPTADEKKAKKEEKKKAKEEKKEAKQKEREEKKKLKAEAKAAKPKKQKPPKEVDKTPPLPKKPVVLIFVLAASIVVIILFTSNGLHYRSSIRQAHEAYSSGDYVEAYSYLGRMKLEEKDEELARKITLLAGMEELLMSHETLYEAGKYEMALDCLVRVLGRYDENQKEAVDLGITAPMGELESQAEEILSKVYQLSYDETIQLYSVRNRVKYSLKLVEQLRKVGLIR